MLLECLLLNIQLNKILITYIFWPLKTLDLTMIGINSY
jgi:hypothetical protein